MRWLREVNIALALILATGAVLLVRDAVSSEALAVSDLAVVSGTVRAQGDLRNAGSSALLVRDASGRRRVGPGENLRYRAVSAIEIAIEAYPDASRRIPVGSGRGPEAMPLDLPALGPAEGGIRRERVTVRDERVDLGRGVSAEGWTYRPGTLAGAPLRMRAGETLEITLENRSAYTHSLHPHLGTMSGGLNIAPGETGLAARVSAPADIRDPLAVWYHCETLVQSEHIRRGMSGLLAVEPRDLRPADRDLALVHYVHIGGDGREIVLFNGAADAYADRPVELVAGQRIRLWLLNGGSVRGSTFTDPAAELTLRFEGIRFERVDALLAADRAAGAPPAVIWDGSATVVRPRLPGSGMVLDATVPAAGVYPFFTPGAYAGAGGSGVFVVRGN